MPTHLKRTTNLAYLENGTHDQIVAHLKTAVELSGTKNDGELPIPTMTAAVAPDSESKTDFSKTS